VEVANGKRRHQMCKEAEIREADVLPQVRGTGGPSETLEGTASAVRTPPRPLQHRQTTLVVELQAGAKA
jgi:hypothetical protein